MDDIDRKAISLLMDATLMSEDEIERTLKILRNMARIKKRKEKRLKSIKDVLDYWACQAYEYSMKA
jgi:rubrerythrin